MPLILWVVYWCYTVVHFEKYLRKIPGKIGLPLFGVALEVRSPTKLLEYVLQYHRIYKSSYKMFVGSQPYLMITEPEDMKFFLSTSPLLKKSEVYDMAKRWLGNSLLISSGDKWRKQKTMVTPAFHLNILKTFIDVFNSQADVFVEKLLEESHKGNVDIYPLAERLTLDIICETIMGTSVNAQNDNDCKYLKCVQTLMDIYLDRAISPILTNNLLYFFTNTYRKEMYATKVVHDYTNSVIAQRRKLLNNTNEDSKDSQNIKRKKARKALLDLLLEYSANDPSFTEKDLQGEVDTFVVGGYDSTATAVTFILYCLARHPVVQRKVYEELTAIFADDPQRKPTSADLQAMKFLEMVVKETLRLYTPIPLIGRKLENDVDWNGVTLPKGLMILICLQCVHKSIDYWGENFETFDPERFNIENNKNRHPYAYVPFSAGIRNCIGLKYAMVELKCIIATTLRRVEVFPANPDKDVILKSAIMLKPINGVYIRLKSR
ncbi:Cytochrome P450 [Popillia japonica]|uniref:Cytochrome P450 n=1 Tax=Popillia japonica TaxID=7064 RepID=A0AAW1JVN0_POPJA